ILLGGIGLEAAFAHARQDFADGPPKLLARQAVAGYHRTLAHFDPASVQLFDEGPHAPPGQVGAQEAPLHPPAPAPLAPRPRAGAPGGALAGSACSRRNRASAARTRPWAAATSSWRGGASTRACSTSAC